jgi:hypothetical protein
VNSREADVSLPRFWERINLMPVMDILRKSVPPTFPRDDQANQNTAQRAPVLHICISSLEASFARKPIFVFLFKIREVA